VDPSKYKSLVPTIKLIMAEEGAAGIWKGWLPTAIGYSLQGCFKFGLYEFFKDFYSNIAGEEASYAYRGLIYLAGSASAEVFADAALCPLEMVKVKVQTSPPGTFPVNFFAALSAMSADKVNTKFPFGSLVPLWSRQVRTLGWKGVRWWSDLTHGPPACLPACRPELNRWKGFATDQTR
jgi:solute carrier family 25 (mitochondrial phosphate transporter), member 3